ncbi:MAG TPA: hypothetical protein VJ842_13155 [Pyrinomonadaceae bacterium]|nr:hypothetical protein [Pyrinomonadaceae bacterium]
MRYIFRGRLCGFICSECWEPLAKVKVRLYDSAEQQQVIARAVANPKETFALLDDDAVKAKERLLIAEAETDEQGNFQFELDDRQQKYDGGAFEVDVLCPTVPRPRLPRKPRPPRQFTITTLQPRWRIGREETSALYVWDYCLPYRFWCYILSLFGLWTICGHVSTCDKDAVNVAGVKVSAFDADWWQDDPLGSAITNSAGKFRIDYLTEDFQRTPFSPFINVELFGGPDLYFKIEDSGGTTLLDETPARARKPDRENVGHCFCVELCVDTDIPPPFDNPLFTHIGDFHILTDINAATGLTNSAVLGHGGPGYGFFGHMKLRGFCPKLSQSGSSLPMRYRFRYATLDDPTTLIPITGNMVSPVIVGSRLIQWKLVGDVLAWTFQTIQIAGAGATPDPTPTPGGPGPWGSVPTHVIVPDAAGWITVDQNGLDDGFYGALIGFKSEFAVPGGSAPGNGPGIAVSVANQKNGAPIKIVFEAAPVGPDPDPPAGPDTFSNEVPNVYINNWNEVTLINLKQFEEGDAGSCTELTNDLDIKYTADHELLAGFSLGISSAAAIPGAPLTLPSGTGPRGGFGTEHLDISGWASCSYIATLSTRRRLTDGEHDDPSRPNSLTFCISGEDM